MLLQIADILTPAECSAIRDVLTDEDIWRDGKATAKGAARAAKENLQADSKTPGVRGVLAKIEKAVLSNPIFKAAAQPDRLARVLISKYAAGMHYGDHVDAPYIDGARSDLSFTVFLTDPGDYQGGALVIDNAGREDAIRGAMGSAVLYPSSSVHRVEPVEEGERLACIGWARSRVKSADHRAILFELETAIADLNQLDAPQPLRNRLANVRNNLLRSFGD